MNEWAWTAATARLHDDPIDRSAEFARLADADRRRAPPRPAGPPAGRRCARRTLPLGRPDRVGRHRHRERELGDGGAARPRGGGLDRRARRPGRAGDRQQREDDGDPAGGRDDRRDGARRGPHLHRRDQGGRRVAGSRGLLGTRWRAAAAPRPASRDGGAGNGPRRVASPRTVGGPGRGRARHQHRRGPSRRVGRVHALRPRRCQAGGGPGARWRATARAERRRFRPGGGRRVRHLPHRLVLARSRPSHPRRGPFARRRDCHAPGRRYRARQGPHGPDHHHGRQGADHGGRRGAAQRVQRAGRHAPRRAPRSRRLRHRTRTGLAHQQPHRQPGAAQRLRVRHRAGLCGLRAQSARAHRPHGNGPGAAGHSTPGADRSGGRPGRPRDSRTRPHRLVRGAGPSGGQGDAALSPRPPRRRGDRHAPRGTAPAWRAARPTRLEPTGRWRRCARRWRGPARATCSC